MMLAALRRGRSQLPGFVRERIRRTLEVVVSRTEYRGQDVAHTRMEKITGLDIDFRHALEEKAEENLRSTDQAVSGAGLPMASS